MAGLAASALAGAPLFGCALWLGMAWLFLNAYCLFRLIRMGLAPKVGRGDTVLLFSVLKFPVLYSAGFFILNTHVFPLAGVFAGLTLFALAAAASWFRPGAHLAARTLTALFVGFYFLAPAIGFAAEHGHAAAHHAEASAEHGHGGERGGDHAHESDQPHVLNWVHLVAKVTAPSPFSEFLTKWEKFIYTSIVVVIIAFLCLSVSRKLTLIPSRKQSFAEMIVQALDDVVCGVMGARGREFTPFIGSIFLYILVSNLYGLIPLQDSIMGFVTTTVPIAVVVFLYVQWTGISKNGIGGYLFHLAGSPTNAAAWCLSPFMMPLHIMGEFIKPVSLAFRLFGNIMAGHILLAVFMTIGINCLKPLNIPFGIPFHVPFLFLEILVSVIQAFVFALLSTIYIAMMLPHEHEHGHEEHGHAEAH